MRPSQYLMLLLMAAFLPCTAMAQAVFSLTGTVLDEAGKPVELATVLLKIPTDSTFQKAAYTDKDGIFSFNNLSANTYQIEASFVGYAKKRGQPISLGSKNPNHQLTPIQLIPDQQQLGTVTVTAKKPYVERLADRIVVNPDALIANAGSSALEALERSPGVSVNEGGDIRLKGRSGVVIFLDDKPTYLSGSELESYLRSIPADQIKRIELMPNPPAKYEASGNAGVINIITKRNKVPGFHGNTALAFAKGKYTRSNNSLNLNLNRKGYGLYSNLGTGYRNFYQDLNINRNYFDQNGNPTSDFSQNSFIVPKSQSYNAKVGLDLYLSEKTTLGFVVKGVSSPSSHATDNSALLLTPSRDTVQKVLADNREDRQFANAAYNINLRQTLDSMGSNLVIDADYVRYHSDADYLFQNFIFNPFGMLTYTDSIDGKLPSTINIYATKADYTKPFGNGLKMEAGAKSAFTKTDNEAAYINTVNGESSTNFDLSNRFLYDEWIHAGYLNFTKSFGNLDLQVGLRVEHTRFKGDQLGNEVQPRKQFTRSYTEPFPTLFAAWHLDSLDKHVFSFSYGRRIDRPFFQDLNPFISPLDKFTFYTGNPNLLPTFSHNFSLTHSFKGILNTTLSYSNTLDGINETLEIVDGIYYSRPGNIADATSVGISVDASLPINNWWTMMLYASGERAAFESDLYTQKLDTFGYNGYLSLNNSLQLGSGWAAEVRGEYQTNQVYSQLYILNFGTLNLAVSKKMLKDAGTFKLSVQDLLHSRRGDGVINNLAQTKANWNSKYDSRVATASFSYRFGKASQQRQRHNRSGSENEQQRVKS